MNHRRAHFLSPAVPAQSGAVGGEEIWSTVADCRHCAVRQRALFAPLRGLDFEQIFLPIRQATLPAGTLIYREDQEADAVYTLRQGLVKLIKRAPDGEERIVRLLWSGANLGLEGLTRGLYWHTAVALREADVCRIPLAVFDALQDRHAQLAERMVAQWECQVDDADRWLAELGAGTVPERVVRLVRLLAQKDAAEGQRLELPPMSDLAAILGSSPESVSRVLAQLKRDRILKRVAPRTYDCDLEALPKRHADSSGLSCGTGGPLSPGVDRKHGQDGRSSVAPSVPVGAG